MDEWLKQFAAIVLGLIGAGPFFYQAWRDRRTRERLQRLARTALDGWGDALALVNRYLIIESDVDAVIKARFEEIEAEYKLTWQEYSGGPTEKK